MKHCGCILLAAGGSSRFGSPKQLLRARGETLLHRAARLALDASLQPVCVVLGSNADQHTREIQDLAVDTIVNAEWQSGMSTSLRAGLARLAPCPEVGHVLILVCDQLAVSIELLRSLLNASRAEPQKIIACWYRDHAGVPCIFPRAHFEELMQLEGDAGARQLLRKYEAALIPLPFPEGEFDIDTPDDALRFGLEPHG